MFEYFLTWLFIFSPHRQIVAAAFVAISYLNPADLVRHYQSEPSSQFYSSSHLKNCGGLASNADEDGEENTDPPVIVYGVKRLVKPVEKKTNI